MLNRTIFGALAAAAVVGGVLVVKALKKEPETEEDEEDDEIHFITIEDGDSEEETPVQDVSGKSEAVKEICGVYPYLTPDFVEGILDTNTKFNEQYEEDTLLTVSHKAGFPSEELKNQFMDIMDTHGYTCTCDGEGTVTASRKFFMENGAVVSDILNVANQTCALKGTYQDYEVNC